MAHQVQPAQGYNGVMRSEFSRRLLGWISLLGYTLLSLLVIFVGEWLPLMPVVQRFQETHSSIDRALTWVTIAMTVLGVLLLAFTQFLVRVPGSRSNQPAQSFQTKGIVRAPGSFFSGMMISAGFSDEVRLWRLKRAFRDGEWWSVPRWRRFSLMMLGAVLFFCGLFGLFFLLSPPGLKFFLFLVVVYATARSVYAFIVDQPYRKENSSG